MREKVQSIQFLRFVAAAMVTAYHITIGLDKYYAGSVSFGFKYLAGFGQVGVHIFFVISGFVMVYTSFSNQTDTFVPSRFFVRRFIRIYPIYWIYAAVYLLFHGLFQDGYALSLGQIVRAYLLLPADSANIIGPGWTLSFEVFFYLCFGLVMVLGLYRGLFLLTLFFLSLLAIRYAFKIDSSWQYLHVFTNSLLLEFLFGAWIAYIVVCAKPIGTKISVAMLIAGLGLFIAGLVFGYARLPAVVVWGIPSMLLVAGFVFNERNGRISKLVQRWSWLGDSSYSLYLLHILLIDVTLMLSTYLHPQFESALGTSAVFIVLLTLCILVSIVAYNYVERPLVLALQSFAKTRLVGLMKLKPAESSS